MAEGIYDLLLMKDKNQQDRFSTLVRAIKAANLTDTLEKRKSNFILCLPIVHYDYFASFSNIKRGGKTKEGPFTFFAPTNDAFKALPDGTLDKLLASPAELKKILLGHLVSGTFFLSGLVTGDLPTLDGGSNHIAVGTSKRNYYERTKSRFPFKHFLLSTYSISHTALTVDGAKINVEADMLASNGVIHVIDRVLLS